MVARYEFFRGSADSNISDASCAVGKLRAHDDYVMSLATNRDGSSLASGGLGGQLFAWDVETLKQKWSTEGTSLDEYSLKGAKRLFIAWVSQKMQI